MVSLNLANDISDFQLMHNKLEWTEERTPWRSVNYLNLVRNVNRILELMSREISDRSLYNVDGPGDMSDDSIEEIKVARSRSLPPSRFQERHRLLQQGLRPLLRLNKELDRRLGAAGMELYSTSVKAPLLLRVLNPFEQQMEVGVEQASPAIKSPPKRP